MFRKTPLYALTIISNALQTKLIDDIAIIVRWLHSPLLRTSTGSHFLLQQPIGWWRHREQSNAATPPDYSIILVLLCRVKKDDLKK